MIEVVQNLVAKEKYQLKCPYSLKVEYIVVHNTYNDAPAKNEVAYMIRNENATGFHYAIDDKEVVQGIPDNRNAWHAGDGNGKGNRKGLGIEICYSKSGGERFDKAELLSAKFIAQKLKEYNLGIDRVIRHYDCSGKNCPHRTMEKGWQRFLNLVKMEMGKGEDEMVEKKTMLVNGQNETVETIFKDGKNFVKLSDLANLGLEVKYNDEKKIVEINFKK